MMKTGLQGVLRGLTASAVAAIAITTVATLAPSPAEAAPVQYVKVCSLYGDGFEYLPGTDICVNFTTADAREQTPGGTWRWRVPNNPHTLVPSVGDACQGGQLTKLGDFGASNLTFNSHDRYETAPTPLNLKPGQYIGSVLYQGGFSGPGVGAGNFCMFYYYNDPTFGPTYDVFGCEDTAGLPGVLQFTPDNPVPPQTTAQMNVLGANGYFWNVPAASQSDIQGKLSIWLCIQGHGQNGDQDE